MAQKRTQRGPPYRAYLVRCWQEDEQWRFMLEAIGPDRRQNGFASFEELVAFMRAALGQGESSAARRRE